LVEFSLGGSINGKTLAGGMLDLFWGPFDWSNFGGTI